MITVTSRMLSKNGACGFARDDFRELFGKEVKITKANIEKAKRSRKNGNFLYENPEWVIDKVLSPKQREKINSDYQKVNNRWLNDKITEATYLKKTWELVLKAARVKE